MYIEYSPHRFDIGRHMYEDEFEIKVGNLACSIYLLSKDRNNTRY